MKILDRYIVREMLGPFFFALVAVTIVLLSADPLPRAARMLERMPVASVAEFLMACIPVVMVYVYPMATLIACLLAFTRLSRDSEIIALRAAGISLYRIALPGVMLALVMSLTALYLAERIVPQANHAQRSLFLRSLADGQDLVAGNVAIRRVDDDGTERIMMARSVDGAKAEMKLLTITFFRDGRRSRVLLVDRAKWSGGQWVMRKVHSLEFDRAGNVNGVSDSEEMIMPFDDPPERLLERPLAREEMTRRQLLEQVRIETVMNEGRLSERAKVCMVEYYMRSALPFSCLVFGLFGIPLGIQPLRSSQAVGFAISVVLLALYYVLFTSGCYLGERGILHPMVAAWLSNGVFATAGVAMLVRSEGN